MVIHSLKKGRDVRKSKWQYRLQKFGERRLPRIARALEWIVFEKARKPIEWFAVIKQAWEKRGSLQGTNADE